MFTIDKNRLDEELMKLPNDLLNACEKASEASYALSVLKQQRDEIRANLDVQIRADAASSGKKTTEASIANEVILHSDVKQILSDIAQAEKVYSDAISVCDALRKKRDCLSDLVKLFLSGYWSAVPGTTQIPTTMKNANTEALLEELRNA